MESYLEKIMLKYENNDLKNLKKMINCYNKTWD